MKGEVRDDEIRVVLSYDNVQALYDAVRHMRNHPSHNSFSLTKRQEDGVVVIVEVNKELDDWKGGEPR